VSEGSDSNLHTFSGSQTFYLFFSAKEEQSSGASSLSGYPISEYFPFAKNVPFVVEVLAVLAAPFILFHPCHLGSYFYQVIRFFPPVQEEVLAVFVIHPVEILVSTAVALFVFLPIDFLALVAVFVVLRVFGNVFYWVLHFNYL